MYRPPPAKHTARVWLVSGYGWVSRYGWVSSTAGSAVRLDQQYGWISSVAELAGVAGLAGVIWVRRPPGHPARAGREGQNGDCRRPGDNCGADLRMGGRVGAAGTHRYDGPDPVHGRRVAADARPAAAAGDRAQQGVGQAAGGGHARPGAVLRRRPGRPV